MIHRVDMTETAGMLEARLRLLERIRRVEQELWRAEQARVAAQLMRGRSHELGNFIQIVKLSALELERRAGTKSDLSELLVDLRQTADQATALLADMFAAARPPDRLEVGPVTTHVVRTAVDLVRPAIAAQIELRIELDDTVHTYSTAEELETMVIAASLDAANAQRISLVLRERVVQNKRWVELLRHDNRQELADGELAHMFEPHSLLHVVVAAAKQARGEASIAPGRGGLELAIELPVAASPSASPVLARGAAGLG